MNEIIEIRKVVKNFFDRNAEYTLPKYFIGNPEIEDTIINIGTSILCTKWNVGPKGGSFVQAVINNDLTGAVSRADATNIYAIKFYCQLMYNVEMPESISYNIV
jgi:hypothetical protein